MSKMYVRYILSYPFNSSIPTHSFHFCINKNRKDFQIARNRRESKGSSLFWNRIVMERG
jgi:hypothetical protein